MRILSFLIVINTISFAQDADSLLEFRFSEMPDDSIKIMELYTKGFESRTKNINDAFLYANACESSANKNGGLYFIAKANNLLGILYNKTGKLHIAFERLQFALKIWDKLDNKEGAALTILNLGNVYSNKNQKNDAEKCYLEALYLFGKTNNVKQKANALNNLGTLKFENGNVKIAKRYFTQAYALGEKLNDYELKAFCSNNLGVICETEKKWDDALAYYDEARELREYMDNQLELADSYNNLASVAFETKDFKTCKKNLKQALIISENQNYAEGKIAVYSFYKNIYLSEKKWDSAFIYQNLFYNEKIKMLEKDDFKSDNLNEQNNRLIQLIELNKLLENKNYTLKYWIGVISIFLAMTLYLIFNQKK